MNRADIAPAQALRPWQFLYFLPLPHGHGSLRPTFGTSRRTGTAAASIASLTTSDLDCGGAALDCEKALPEVSSGALNCRGSARRKFSNAASELAERNTFAAISL